MLNYRQEILPVILEEILDILFNGFRLKSISLPQVWKKFLSAFFLLHVNRLDA